MVAELVTIAILILSSFAELIHFGRCRSLAILAFGPSRRRTVLATIAPFLRVTSYGALAWGLTTLLLLSPKIHKAAKITESELKHIVLVLDVSPSMRLEDAGPSKVQTRSQRASDLMESFFMRVPMEQYRISVIATYTGAKAVVVDTKDTDVVRNILKDLPMHHAFEVGQTQIFAGLVEAAKVAKPWRPKSTTVILLSDGDTVPAKGMPKMPASVSNVLVVGVGDPRTGKFINGKHSKQDTSTLREIATRLKGTYHNGNEKHVSSITLNLLTQATGASPLNRLSRREYALIACAIGALIAALLPFVLHYFGTAWRPGTRVSKSAQTARALVAD